jgi:hypothetical protein
MKLLTLNFLTCAIKTCKTNPASFPLHPRDAELEIVEADVNLAFLKNILPRILWDELRGICSEVRENKNTHPPKEPGMRKSTTKTRRPYNDFRTAVKQKTDRRVNHSSASLNSLPQRPHLPISSNLLLPLRLRWILRMRRQRLRRKK